MSLKKIQELPSQDYLKMLFSYDPDTGILKWADRLPIELLTKYNWSSRRYKRITTSCAGLEAGHEFKTTSGAMSRQLRLDYVSYYVHRIIWKLVYGEDPELIDHIDGDPLNNRLVNLRNVSNIENCKNSKLFCTNTSGYVGVSFNKVTNKHEAYIWENYKKINLGHFEDKEVAIQARKDAASDLNYHENHGRNNEVNN